MSSHLPKRLLSDLKTSGLQILGSLPAPDSGARETLLLIGPDEPHFWGIFTASAEYRDGAADPLDRWSLRILSQIAQTHQADALFPFGGPPFEPFYTWAVETQKFWPSPIGFLVHGTSGLFASFRGALRVNVPYDPDPAQSPCPSCAAPCKTACPVDAFSDGYDVAKCKQFLKTPEGAMCMTDGCRARRACPVGQNLRLPDQAAFHMEAFL